jgi:hypothetical protein
MVSGEKAAVVDDLLLVSPCEVDTVRLYAEVAPAMRLDVFPFGIVRLLVLEETFALEDAIGSHACWLEASMRVTQ